MFHVQILLGPVWILREVPKSTKTVWALYMCEYWCRNPTNQFPNPTTPHTVLFARRIYKKEFERLGSGREHSNVNRDTQQTPNGQSHTMILVIIKNLYQRIFNGDARRVPKRETWVRNASRATKRCVEPSSVHYSCAKGTCQRCPQMNPYPVLMR